MYGPIAHVCIELAGDDERKNQWLHRVRSTVQRLEAGKQDWLPTLDKVGASHSVFGIQKSPIANVDDVQPLSRFISSLIIQRAEAVDIMKAKEMLDTLLRSVITRESGGIFFERFVHARLRNGASLAVVGRHHRTTVTIDPTPSGSDDQSQPFSAFPDLGQQIKTRGGQLLQLGPSHSSYPFVNSIMRRGETIWLFQVVLSKLRNIGAADLDDLLRSIPTEYRPTTDRKAKLVIITLKTPVPWKLEPLSPAETTRKAWWEARLEKYTAVVDGKWLCMSNLERAALRPAHSRPFVPGT